MTNKTKAKKYLDLRPSISKSQNDLDFSLRLMKKSRATLFTKNGASSNFFTEDSRLYLTPKEADVLRNSGKINRKVRTWDSISTKVARQYVKVCAQKNRKAKLSILLGEKIEQLEKAAALASESFFGKIGLVRAWNLSIVAAIVFGMFTMTMIYRYLGPGASAGSVAPLLANQNEIFLNSQDLGQGTVLGASDEKREEGEGLSISDEVLRQLEQAEQKEFEQKAKKMVKGYPIEKMLPYILEKDRTVAAFMLSIGKKESNWGKRVPVLDGQDCYNYWGYRAQRKLMGSGGHTCFNSRKDAVDTVAKRIGTLVYDKKLETPQEMVLWKCGSTCSGQDKDDVAKWISDIKLYMDKLQ